ERSDPLKEQFGKQTPVSEVRRRAGSLWEKPGSSEYLRDRRLVFVIGVLRQNAQPVADGEFGQAGDRVNFQLGHDVVPMRVHGAHADVQYLGYLGAAL